ncbi:hypothetical protein SAMN05444336_1134 [Albimonas donghaensis]|uniref:Sulfotransferase family protein n=1 Tax=Albimonas donghaensis TaxID=356660 RepID=A0A1H3FL26_9RHOB|nr:sulfotransferase family protein [Albimonas donghaensis]SDX91813.1 hypothetical protein SAMN05444336_1134 [Albimonas donghaensis]
MTAPTTPKVFCLGFQKTGTTSLGLAMSQLGLRVAGYREFRGLATREDLDWPQVEALAVELAETHDAFKDTPWPVLYRMLDARYPGSRFILVTRDPQAWIRSAARDFADHPNAIHQLIYGSPYPLGHEAAWLARYERHNREVRDHFADRPGDFLEIETGSTGSWEQLCGFLGLPVPDRPWPHANTAGRKRLKMAWWKTRERALRQAGRLLGR